MSKSGLTGVVEIVRVGDLQPSVVPVFSWDVRLFVLFGICVLCLYCAMAVGPISHSILVDSNCYTGFQCTS